MQGRLGTWTSQRRLQCVGIALLTVPRPQLEPANGAPGAIQPEACQPAESQADTADMTCKDIALTPPSSTPLLAPTFARDPARDRTKRTEPAECAGESPPPTAGLATGLATMNERSGAAHSADVQATAQDAIEDTLPDAAFLRPPFLQPVPPEAFDDTLEMPIPFPPPARRR